MMIPNEELRFNFIAFDPKKFVSINNKRNVF